MRDAVGLPVQRVVVLALEAARDVGEVRDQPRVHRSDVAALHEAHACVAGRRDAVVLARRDQVDHVVRGRAVLRHDLAAALLRELVGPRLVRVARPDHEVDFPLVLGLLLDLVERRAESRDLRRGLASALVAAALAPAAAAGGDEGQRAGDEGEHAPAGEPPVLLVHASPSVAPGLSISSWCSGRHSRRTARPAASSAWADEVSRFCCATWSSPPRSSSTTKRVIIPA